MGTTLKIRSDSSVTFKDYPSIKGEEIAKYITFKTTSHFYPKILVNQPENMPHLVEGDEESEPKKNRSVIEL